MTERMENGIPYLFFFATSQEPRLIRGQATRARKPCLSKTMSHIIYQRRHRCCRSIPSHQFAAVPCSQHRHILIYPNVLHTNNPSQFANRANHPIALTLPAIQGGPFLLDGSWRQVSHFANDTHTHTHSVSTPMCMDPPRCRTIPRRIWRGGTFTLHCFIDRSIDRSTSVKTPSKRKCRSHVARRHLTQAFIIRLADRRGTSKRRGRGRRATSR